MKPDILSPEGIKVHVFLLQAIEEEGGNPDEIVVQLEITPKKAPRRTPKGKKKKKKIVIMP